MKFYFNIQLIFFYRKIKMPSESLKARKRSFGVIEPVKIIKCPRVQGLNVGKLLNKNQKVILLKTDKSNGAQISVQQPFHCKPLNKECQVKNIKIFKGKISGNMPVCKPIQANQQDTVPIKKMFNSSHLYLARSTADKKERLEFDIKKALKTAPLDASAIEELSLSNFFKE